MNLKSYYNKKVKIVDKNGHVFSGIVDEYFFPEDNESGVESIVIETHEGDLYEFAEDTIEKINII